MPSMNAASKAGTATLVFYFAKHREISTSTDPKISSILATFLLFDQVSIALRAHGSFVEWP